MVSLDSRGALAGRLLPDGVAQEGFTSSSLQLYLDNIRSRTKQVKAAILDHLDAGAQSGAVLDEEVARKLQDALSRDALSREGRAAAWAGPELLEAAQLCSAAAAEVEAARAEVAKLEAEANWSKRLVEITEHTHAGDFVCAARVLKEVREVLGVLPPENPPDETPGTTPAASPLSQKLRPYNPPSAGAGAEGTGHPELHAAEKELKKALAAWWKAAVHVQDEEVKAIELRRPDHKAEIKGFWEAVEVVGVYPNIVRKAGDMLMNTAIKPVVLESGVDVQASESLLRLCSPAGKPKKPKVEAACKLLEGVLQFVAERLAGGDPHICSRIGENLWPRIVKGLEAKHLSRLEPKDAAGLAAFRNAAAAAVRLEDRARELGLWVAAEAPLREYADDVAGGFQARRLQGLLAAARDLIVQPPGGEVFDAGEPIQDSPLPLHVNGQEGNLLGEGPVKVTAAGMRLPQLMEEAVSAAAEADSPEDAAALCRAVEGMASMMCSLPQAVHKQQLQAPQLAALYYNDCMQAACAAATLPLAFGPRLTEKLGAKVSFMEAAVSLQAAGQAALDGLLAEQRQQLMEVLDGAKGFDLYQQTAGLTCRKAVSAAVHSLRRLAAVVREVLSPPAFIRFAGSLLQAACSRAAQDVLAKRDISADESEEIPEILLPLLEDAPAAMAGLESGAKASPKGAEVLLGALKASAPAWAQLEAIKKLLQARLAHIPSMWESGELRSAGLSAPDVHRMVLALFEDTEMRDEQLERMVD